MKIDAYVITIPSDDGIALWKEVYESSNKVENDQINMVSSTGVTPDRLNQYKDIKWNYTMVPTGAVVVPDLDVETGLMKNPYITNNPDGKKACFYSHYNLWKMCAETVTPIIVLEHDARFVRKLDKKIIDKLLGSNYGIIGLNDPRGATRKSALYHEKIQEKKDKFTIIPAPWIDDKIIPQGLAGNSAYFMHPHGAEMMLTLTERYGAWPNDALMCRQLLDKSCKLGVTTTYYTKVSGKVSTTT